jgi:hypothetical protein
MTSPVITIEDHGTIALLTPGNEAVRTWLVENTADDAQWHGASLVVEPRYLEDLVQGLLNAIEEGDV